MVSVASAAARRFSGDSMDQSSSPSSDLLQSLEFTKLANKKTTDSDQDRKSDRRCDSVGDRDCRRRQQQQDMLV